MIVVSHFICRALNRPVLRSSLPSLRPPSSSASTSSHHARDQVEQADQNPFHDFRSTQQRRPGRNLQLRRPGRSCPGRPARLQASPQLLSDFSRPLAVAGPACHVKRRQTPRRPRGSDGLSPREHHRHVSVSAGPVRVEEP